MKISDRVILPLVGSAFQPGKAAEAIEKIEDKELAQIAQGEYYFFSAQAKKCVETVKDYLDHDDVMLRLSADMLYTFANLTLGDPQAAQCTREDVHQCLTQAMQEDAPVNVKAACLFAFYVISIFLHIPPEEGTPPLQQYIPYLPIGQRLFAVSLLAHEIYLRQDYAKAKGVVQGAFLMADGVYPISMIYLGCVQAMCQINLKEQEEAIQTVSQSGQIHGTIYRVSWSAAGSFGSLYPEKRAGNVQEACRWCTCIQPWLDEDSQSQDAKGSDGSSEPAGIFHSHAGVP